MKLGVYISLILLLLISSCSSDSKKNEPDSLTHLPLNERLKRIYTENKEEKLDFQIFYESQLAELYKLSGYQSIWHSEDTINSKGAELLSFFDSTELYGLPKHLYPINQLRNSKDPLQLELALSESLIRVSLHLKQGILDSNQTTFNRKISRFNTSLADTLFQTISDSSFIEKICEFQPLNFQYRWLQASWAKYYRKTKMDTVQFKVPSIKEDSAQAYQIARKILFHRKYIDSSGLTTDSIFLEALEKYQEEHFLKGDHVIGKQTRIALEKNSFNKFQQVVLALDKFRWTQDLPEKYFRVNIPEQKVRLIDSNRIIREHRIIVGHEDTQTPELKSRVKRMVLYPYWNVPHSISSTEILYGARRDTGFFRKKGYKVFRGKTEVDPKTVNWKKYKKNNFPFRIRQEPGPKNSLGLIKFLFPNEHSVYMHDTPTKWLFKTKSRYYSHGCMRLEKPFELAQYIIATDPKNKFIADSLEVEMAKEEQQSIYLRKPIPIFVEYITVIGDSLGNINFYNDFYGRDEKFINAIFGKD